VDAFNIVQPSYDFSEPAAAGAVETAVSDAHAAAELEWEWCTVDDAGNDGGLGFTKLSDELLCCNTILTISNNNNDNNNESIQRVQTSATMDLDNFYNLMQISLSKGKIFMKIWFVFPQMWEKLWKNSLSCNAEESFTNS